MLFTVDGRRIDNCNDIVAVLLLVNFGRIMKATTVIIFPLDRSFRDADVNNFRVSQINY